MKPLAFLLFSFTITLFGSYFFNGAMNVELAARLALSFMFLYTGFAHFVYTKGLTMTLPPVIPQKKALIYSVGVFEAIVAICLQIPQYTTFTAWAIIFFLILMIPVNIYAASQQINFREATNDGPDLIYLWFRIPLQMLFIFWTYLSAIYIW